MLNKPGVIVIDGHVQGLALTRSLGEKGIPVVVVDRNQCIARYSRYCKKFFRSPEFLSNDFVPFLIELAKSEELNGWAIFPTDDHVVYQLSKNKDLLSRYFIIISPDWEVFQMIYYKKSLLEIASLNGIPIPKTNFFPLSDEDLNQLEFPIILKGNEGQTFYKKTGKKAYLINDKEQLKVISEDLHAKLSYDDYFIQELIPYSEKDRTVSFTCFAIDGEIKTFWIGRKLREHPFQFGTATLAESISPEQELMTYSQKLIEKLNCTGTCEIEYMKDIRDNNYKLIEINPRTWLWVGLAKKCGVDYADYMYNYLYDIKQEYPSNYKYNMIWKNEITDIIFQIIRFMSMKINLKNLIGSFSKTDNSALRNKFDRKPFFMYLLFLPYILLKRG